MNPPSLLSNSPSRQTARAVELIGLGTAVPPLRLTQKESLDFILSHFQIREATKSLYKRVFDNESVETRHFAMDDPSEVLETNHERISARFEKWAVRLSAASLQRALKTAGLLPKDLDFLAVTTCTGYLCPGLSAYLVEACGLRSSVQYADIVGMGCGAAVPALQQAHNFVSANPGAAAAAVSTEICSAAMFSDDAPDLVISNALFADGSAAALLTSREIAPVPSSDAEHRLPRFRGFASLVVPEWRDTLRFRTDGGRLRNVLTKDVPVQAAQALTRLVHNLLHEQDLAFDKIDHWIFHAGGEKILGAIQKALSLPPDKLEASRRVLKQYGNMSSPTVLFVLKEQQALRSPQHGEWGVLASFGAGFSVHGALLEF